MVLRILSYATATIYLGLSDANHLCFWPKPCAAVSLLTIFSQTLLVRFLDGPELIFVSAHSINKSIAVFASNIHNYAVTVLIDKNTRKPFRLLYRMQKWSSIYLRKKYVFAYFEPY